MNGSHNHTFNKDIWSIIHKCIEVTLRSGNSVIVDAVNVWQEYRSDELKMYRAFGAKRIVGIVFQTPLEKCLKRNSTRRRKVTEDFIELCYEEFMKFPQLWKKGSMR